MATQTRRLGWRGFVGGAAAVALVAGLAAPAAAAKPTPPGRGGFTLTLLHNNDGESQLLNAPNQPDFGGVARFKTLVDDLKSEALHGRGKRGVVMISSGDNFLAGTRFAASLEKGVPFYDSIALDAVGYDAMIVGNHEFDFGPDVLADFIRGFRCPDTRFVSANLDVSAEPSLRRLAKAGILVKSMVVAESGERIGIVGATTPRLPFISSPRNVKVLEDVRGVAQRQIDLLLKRGVNKIVFASHLQSIAEDRQLIPQLRGVDVAIAGGGDELLANEDDLLVPGDTRAVDPATGQPYSYPILATGADGRQVPIVTTAGDYKYVGRLVIQFDKAGNVVTIDDDSGPVRVSGVAPDAVNPDPVLVKKVVEPVRAFEANLAQNVVAQSDVALNGVRSPGIRTQETGLGDLVADSLLTSAQARAAAFGAPSPVVAFQNGGGIRNNSVIPAGPITELDTFNIVPFANFVSIVPNVERATIKSLLENAVSAVAAVDGRFAQVAGLRFTYSLSGTAQVTATDGTITTPGTRVQSVVLDDGTAIVQNGQVVPGPAISIATIDFLARGGDQYPLTGLPFTTLGITYQQGLQEHVTQVLGGVISAADYPVDGEGRITQLP